MQSKKKISIIGAGNVGSTIAYTLMQQGTCSEILLVDINRDKAEGESLDLAQCAACFPSVKVRFGEYEDAAGSDIVIENPVSPVWIWQRSTSASSKA